jgi:hypothetical protein
VVTRGRPVQVLLATLAIALLALQIFTPGTRPVGGPALSGASAGSGLLLCDDDRIPEGTSGTLLIRHRQRVEEVLPREAVAYRTSPSRGQRFAAAEPRTPGGPPYGRSRPSVRTVPAVLQVFRC